MIFPLSWTETKISYAGASISVEYFDSLWVHFLWKRASWPNAVEKSLKMQEFISDSEKWMGAHRRIIAAGAQPVESER